MLGNQRNNNGGGKNPSQTMYLQVNTKEYVNSGTAPYFDVYYVVKDENGSEHKVRLSTDSVGGYVRNFYVYEDAFGKKTNKKFVISLDDYECPYMNEKGEADDSLKMRNTYIVSSVFSMKGQELANKLCRVFEEGNTAYISIRFQQQFEKDSNGNYTIPKKDKEGKNVYNLNVFHKEGDKVVMVMPLFSKNEQFGNHPLNEKWVEAWESASKNKTNTPMGEFFEGIINGGYRDTAFSMFQKRMEEKGYAVEMEINADTGKPRYKFTKDDENPDANGAPVSIPNEDAPTAETDDDLPF